MDKIAKTYIGVDVSKAFLDIYLYPEQKTIRIENTVKGLMYLYIKLGK